MLRAPSCFDPLSMPDDLERRYAIRRDRAPQVVHRLRLSFIAEPERAVVHWHADVRAEDLVRLHRLAGIDVRGTHEPAREVRADRQHRETDRLKAIPNPLE